MKNFNSKDYEDWKTIKNLAKTKLDNWSDLVFGNCDNCCDSFNIVLNYEL